MNAIGDIATDKLSRRSLLTKFGAAGVGLAATAMLAGCGGSSSNGGGISQTDVLNFALNLEYLEASFYSYALTGAGLSSADLGGTPTVTPVNNISASLSAQQLAIFQEIAADELNHVRDLRSALGNNAVPCPNLNLAAVGNTTSVALLLAISKAFEDVGVTAYAGASTLLSGTNLQYAADILAVEAFHSANLRLLIAQAGVTTSPVDPHAPIIKDILPPPSGTKYWATDAAGIAYNRNPSEVLSIVLGLGGTLTIGTKTGGFFPNGLNGNINTITTSTPDAA
jgi:hypothetical protein